MRSDDLERWILRRETMDTTSEQFDDALALEEESYQQQLRLWLYSTDRSTKAKWFFAAAVLLIIISASAILLISHNVQKYKYGMETDMFENLTSFNRSKKYQRSSHDCEDERFGRRLRYSLGTTGNMYVYIRGPARNGTRRRVRLPVARYHPRAFPLASPFVNFQVTLPIFQHTLSAQTVLYSSKGAIYVLPALFNNHGQVLSLAELIASEYAAFGKKRCRRASSVDFGTLFHRASVIGPGIPTINLTTGIFRGGVDVSFRRPLSLKVAKTPTYIEITYNNGDRYEGYLNRGVMNGNGTLYYADGRKYAGHFINGTSSGYGEMKWTDSARYEGHWAHDMMNGNGTYYYADGRKYVGRSADDTADGFGEMFWPDGDHYEGYWKNDSRNGNGTCFYADGRKYVGHYKDDTLDGYGEMWWPQGDHYTGQWENDQINGHGTYYYADGRRYVGHFTNDTLNGYGEMVWPSTARYAGFWKEDKMNGNGTYHYPDGKRYEGQSGDDAANGFGVMIWPAGDRYDGYWKNDNKHGLGKLVFANGTIREGTWRNDVFID